MPVDDTYIEAEGLSGPEIVESAIQFLRARLYKMADDITEKVEQKCLGDCSLRPSDNYPYGYSATIDIKLNLMGIDTETIQLPISVSKGTTSSEGVFAQETVDIPYDPDVNAVRERSQQAVPSLSRDAEGQTEPRGKRSYNKRVMGGGGNAGEPLNE